MACSADGPAVQTYTLGGILGLAAHANFPGFCISMGFWIAIPLERLT